MYFPSPFHPDETHRAGRMMMAGRVKVTVTSPTTGDHITILLKCFADNRNRQFAEAVNKNWVPCALPDATHVFAEVPNQSGWNDKVGTFYPKTGRWYDADGADKRRVYAAQAAGHWLMHPGTPPGGGSYQESLECGVCGKELTDPESIERGIGPVCFGNLTGSHHQEKVEEEEIERPSEEVVIAKDFLHAEQERELTFGDQNMVKYVEVTYGVDLRNLGNEEIAKISAAVQEERHIRAHAHARGALEINHGATAEDFMAR